MKMRFENRLNHLLVLLTFLLLVGNPVLACLIPSMPDMAGGETMACCEQECRMESTAQAAKKACEQTRSASAPSQVVPGPTASISHLTVSDLPDASPLARSENPPADRLALLMPATDNIASVTRPSVPIYLRIRSLLI